MVPSLRYGDPLRKLRSHTGRWQIFLCAELVASRPPRGGDARVRVVGATRDHSKQKPTPVRNECAPRRFTPRGPPIGELFADVERPDPRSLVVPHSQPPPILRILFDQIPPKATQCYSPSFLSPRAFFGYSLLSPGRERGSGRLILQRNQVCAHPLTRKHSPKKRTVTPPCPSIPSEQWFWRDDVKLSAFGNPARLLRNRPSGLQPRRRPMGGLVRCRRLLTPPLLPTLPPCRAKTHRNIYATTNRANHLFPVLSCSTRPQPAPSPPPTRRWVGRLGPLTITGGCRTYAPPEWQDRGWP